jgi:hypothetical protein
MPIDKSMFQEIGSSGVNRWGGNITDEFITDLQGKKGNAQISRNVAQRLCGMDDAFCLAATHDARVVVRCTFR